MSKGRELTKSEVALPGTPEHTRMITSSKVAPMLRDEFGDFLGIGYDSAYDTYQYLTGAAEKDVSGMEEIFRYGHAAEKFARYWLQDTMPGWKFSAGEVAFGHHPELKFPHQATVDMRASKGRRRAVVEVKAPKVDRGVEDKWIPQITMNMACSGAHETIFVIVPRYGEVSVHHIEFEPGLWEAIVEDTNDFWRRIQEGDAPEAGGSELWREEQGVLNPPDKNAPPVTLNEGYTERYENAVREVAAAEERLEVVKNEIIEQMGTAPRVNGADGRKIVTRTAGRFSQKRVPEAALRDMSLYSQQFDTKKLKEKHPDWYEAARGNPSYVFDKKGWMDND